MLVSGIFKQPEILVVVPDVLSKFSKIENVFFFSWSVWCQDQLQLYSIERDLKFQFRKLSLNNFHALKNKQFSLHLCALNITGEEAGQSKNMN